MNKETISLIHTLDDLRKTYVNAKLIDRDELLKRIDAERKHLLDIKMDGAEHIIVHHARRIIEDMPSITPQKPKTGHWIDTGSGQECSECGEIQYGYDTFRFFCANCGTEMSGGDSE